MRSTIGSSARVLSAAALAALLLTGCSAPTESNSREPGASASGTPTSASAPAPAPIFDPSASADDALSFFDNVNATTLATDADANGRSFIDGLVAQGFDKATMELTADETTIGHAADSIQFSVRWGESCLIGQNGSAVGGYHSTLAPVLGTGACLIGSTRPIDW